MSRSRTYKKPANDFPTPALLPKVSLPYENIPGQVPRDIEVERKRREYRRLDISIVSIKKQHNYY